MNGLERDYLPEDNRTGFQEYLTPDGQIQMAALLDNFRNFIARVGFKILQVPDTPQEYIGQYLLFAYLEQFVQMVGGTLSLEVQTGRGRMDLLIRHNQRKYIVETKIWGWRGALSVRQSTTCSVYQIRKSRRGVLHSV